MSDSPARREAVGEAFSLAAMLKARDLTFEALRRIDRGFTVLVACSARS